MMSATKMFVLAAVIVLAACEPSRNRECAPCTPLAEVEANFGVLITAGNHPTPNQHGTGERVGIFRQADGEIWGLPLIVEASGAVLACAPPLTRLPPVTDTFPAGSSIIGATNAPTGWRAGTGNLELLLRDERGRIQWQAVAGAPSACQAFQNYYRLAPRR